MSTTTTHPSNSMLPSNRSWLPSWPYLLLTGLALLSLIAMVSPTLTLAWQFDRSAIQHGQWWRLLTGHLTHWNLDHWIWDWSTFVALGLVSLKRSPQRTHMTIGIAAVSISVALWVWYPNLETYRGLSGVDTALFTLLATELLVQGLRDKRYLLTGMVLLCTVGLVAKMGYEMVTGNALFVDSAAAGFETITLAHVVGAAVGIAMVVKLRAGSKCHPLGLAFFAPLP
ncbi:MAG: rhombosortase [Pirellulales bacterium]